MNINVLFLDLPENVNGFFLNSKIKSSILIKKSLSARQRETVCAHELAHALLHSCVNSINYEEDDPSYILQLEDEANNFCKLLLES